MKMKFAPDPDKILPLVATCHERGQLRTAASQYGVLTMKFKAILAILPGFVLLVSCTTHRVEQIPLNAVQCTDPRPQICTMDYTPVCATRDNGMRCATTPCESTETATYANACMACADPAVMYHLPAACGSQP